MTSIAAAVVAGMTALQLLRRRNLAEPTVLLGTVWATVLLLDVLAELRRPEAIGPLSNTVLVVVVAGVAMFFLGDELAARCRPADRSIEPCPLELHPVIDRIALAVPFVALLLFVIAATRMVGGTEEFSFFRALRWQLTEGQRTYGLLAYLVPVTVFCTWLQLCRLESRPRDSRAVAGFVSAMVATIPVLVLMTGRTYIALLFVFLTNFRYVGGRGVKLMTAVFLGIFVVVYGGMSVVLHKGGSPEAAAGDNIASVSSFAAWYAIGPVRAFDHALHHPDVELRQGRTTRFFRALSFRLGLSLQPPEPLVQPEVEAPFRTNVYTLFATYVTDFGFALTLMFLGLLGAAHQALFMKARSGFLWARYGNALMSYPLVMSFFQDQYLSLLSTWLQYLALYLIVVVALAPRRGSSGGNESTTWIRSSPPPAANAGEHPVEGP